MWINSNWYRDLSKWDFTVEVTLGQLPNTMTKWIFIAKEQAKGGWMEDY